MHSTWSACKYTLITNQALKRLTLRLASCFVLQTHLHLMVDLLFGNTPSSLPSSAFSVLLRRRLPASGVVSERRSHAHYAKNPPNGRKNDPEILLKFIQRLFFKLPQKLLYEKSLKSIHRIIHGLSRDPFTPLLSYNNYFKYFTIAIPPKNIKKYLRKYWMHCFSNFPTSYLKSLQ